MTLRLYTHNIYARRAGWESRRTLLRDGIARFEPDVVLFQEEELHDDYDQSADILGEAFEVVHSRGRSALERSGISIASRWPIASVRELDLTVDGPPVDEYVWTTLIATINSPDGPVVVANHFPRRHARPRERETSAGAIARRSAWRLARHPRGGLRCRARFREPPIPDR